ncbi:hypothetical protein NQZ68_013691 [Dissostichus eleginoides]|nr:hypothetical protein NQZ68_013691 [Dissostichus eleginoides]
MLGDPLGVGGRVFWMEVQDLDYNTVIVYFTTDDLIRVNPEEWRGEGTRLSPPSSSLHSSPCPFTESPTPCLGSLGMGGGQGSRRQPLDSPLRERSLGLLTQWHYLSSSLGYCSGEHFLSLCKHFLSLA